MIQILSLLLLAEAAVLFDLDRARIPNGLILAGLGLGFIYQTVLNSWIGILLYLGGVLLPLLVLGGLYYFRMIGAGDIKLLSVLGGFIGPAACFVCLVRAILIGGILSFVLVLHRRSLAARLCCFAEYLSDYLRTGIWKPYLQGVDEQARFCFSIPVLLSILCYMRERISI